MTRNSSIFLSLGVFLTSFLHVSNISNYVLSLRLGYVQWHFWAVSILVCAALALFSGRIFKVPRPWMVYLGWVAVFMGVCALSLLLVDSGDVPIQGMISYSWFFASSLVLVLVVRNSPDIKACGLGIVAGVTLLAVLSIMEFLDPNFQVIVDAFFEDKAQVGELNRVGALYENSNDNGIAMVLGMFLGQFFLPVRLRIAFYILVGVAVFGTVSRTSITIWAAAVILSMLLGFGSRNRIIGFAGVGFIVFLGYLLVAGQIPVIVASLGWDELLTEDMRVRLSENFFTQVDGSTLARVEVVHDVWRLFLESPLTGIGVGVSDSVGIGTHNQHLKIASELGVFGFIVYSLLAVLAVYSRSIAALVFLLLYTVVGFTNHSMMTYTVYSILLPTALVFLPALHRFEVDQKKSSWRRRRRSSKRSGSGVRAGEISELA